MPVSYRIEPTSECIFVTLEGIVTDEEIIKGQRKMFCEPLFVGRYPRLIDATGVTNLAVTAHAVRIVSRAAAGRGVRRVALVANSDFVYAMMRMYEGYAYEVECFVCRERDEALAWLFGNEE
jgi:hypothetical protein